MLVAAYGIIDASPMEVSMMLQSLRVSHTIVSHVPGARTLSKTLDGLSHAQPAWPVIVDNVRLIPRLQIERERLIYLVTDSRAALAMTSISNKLWPENRRGDLIDALPGALAATDQMTSEIQVTANAPTIEDYVNSSTKPTFLNNVQTAFYQITPYDLRKEVQLMCIAYLAGAVKITELRNKLRTSIKLEVLAGLMLSEKAESLKTAVAATRVESVEKVAKDFNCEQFELLYVINSYEKNKDPRPKGKGGRPKKQR